MDLKFYKCKGCGSMVVKLKDGGCPIMCCGKAMEQIKVGVTEAATEKHIPVYSVEGNIVRVCVGEVAHPMVDNHWIEWVLVNSKEGNQRKALSPGSAPEVDFALTEGDEVEAVYAYCNLHGLWKAAKAR